MPNKTTLTTLAAVLALGSAGFSQPASAQPPQTASVKIHYRLDLSSEAGAKTMLRRIQSAAQYVCGDEEYWIFQDPGYHKCVRQSTDRAVAQLSSPLVTALNSGERDTAPSALASR